MDWNLNRVTEASVWCVGILLLLLLVPRQRIREAVVSFLFMLGPAWILGLTVVQLGLVAYPSRFMEKAVRTSFTYEFFALPTISVLYNLHYPWSRPLRLRVIYVLAYPTVLTGIELLLEQYTELVDYIHWNGFATWLSIAAVLHGTHWIYVWFSRGSLQGRYM